MKSIDKRKGILIFDYTTDIIEDSEIISSEILNIDINKEFTLDCKSALENLYIFHALVGTLKYNYSVLIGNLDEDLLDSYRLIFSHIADGGDLIYHYGGIVKKLSFEQKKENALIKEILKDFKYKGHGCLVSRTQKYLKEKEIAELVLSIRLKY